MSSPHISHDEFFSRLAELFEANRKEGKGSVFLTQKRLNFDLSTNTSNTPTKVADDPLWDLHPPAPVPIIVRASNGKWKEEKSDKVKISTIVQPDAVEGFFVRYADVCKGGMPALKKRDRSKRKKTKKKKGGASSEAEKKI